ncbi:hypothetical protein ACIGBH_37065 [Streptomyces sp. NPDC085929]|uniref:hypothetical protein n=1 Tax=Streptomyces sp. NPDC085929 TaxID=3365739 RepID=UPI0037D817AB
MHEHEYDHEPVEGFGHGAAEVVPGVERRHAKSRRAGGRRARPRRGPKHMGLVVSGAALLATAAGAFEQQVVADDPQRVLRQLTSPR